MGKTILTPKQSQFLELASVEKQIVKHFYLTGGTALAAFYYQHRLSEDIDLFCEKREVDPNVAEALVRKLTSKLGVTEVKRSQFLGLVSFLLIYPDGEQLKIDFNYYPFPRIEKGTLFKQLSIDSIYDIAVNKVHTMFIRPRSRDYLDLYTIFQRENYTLDKLILDAKAKFDWDIDRPTLASQFMRVKDLNELPTMLVPFDRDKMVEFYFSLAKSLKKDIFR